TRNRNTTRRNCPPGPVRAGPMTRSDEVTQIHAPCPCGRRRGGDMPELAEWDGYYAIVGSAAGALIGLQFVAMTLIAQRPPLRAAEAGAAFATPTIVHFAAALLLSAALRAPWRAVTPPAALWGLMGAGGVAYAAVVARRMRAQPVYRPVF